MKLLILSDEHRDSMCLEMITEKEKDADAIIFLGDGAADVEAWQKEHPRRRVYLVAGNCDVDSYAPAEGLAAFDGILFFYTHGHLYGVKMTRGILADAAVSRGAQVALFGHTHTPFCGYENGVFLFNPGSLSYTSQVGGPSYGIITTAPDGTFRAEHCRL